MNNEILKVGTFFSGIGAPEKALERLKQEKYIKDYQVMFFSEIDKHAIKSYCAIHNISENLNLGDITKLSGKDLPRCNLWIGGFPCQDISAAGNMKGFEIESKTRSSLGWEMIRLLKEVNNKPEGVIFENVAMITSKKFKTTLELFKKDLKELGYTLYESVLSANDYEIPQMRKRYFLIAILNNCKKFSFPSAINKKVCLYDLLEKDVDEKYYLTTSSYTDDNSGKRVFSNIKNSNVKYIVDYQKYLKGGVCGYNPTDKFNQTSRLFSPLGIAPTITASNTANNCKIVIEEGE